jgi:hypothetical protein
VFVPVSDWFPAFLVTVAVETPIVVYLLRAHEPDIPRLIVLILFANLATHLAVWYVFTQLFLVGTVEYTIAAEAWAVSAETVFYKAAVGSASWRRAFGVALVANVASFAVGRVL